MLVFEATDTFQGQRPDDYHHATAGELVYITYEECCDPKCGCQRGFVGFESLRGTTTAMVVERPDLTIERLAELQAMSLYEGGWLPEPDPGDELVSWLVTDIVELARSFGRLGPGAVVERSGDELCHRLPPGSEWLDAVLRIV